jgi:hypothetical protein
MEAGKCFTWSKGSDTDHPGCGRFSLPSLQMVSTTWVDNHSFVGAVATPNPAKMQTNDTKSLFMVVICAVVGHNRGPDRRKKKSNRW